MTTNKYLKGKIYRLVNSVDDEFYIGSTCNPLHKRLYVHKYKAKSTTNRNVYKHLNEIGWDNVSIVLIEEHPCKNKMELERRERHWIEEMKPTLNKSIPTRTHREYREKNKDVIAEKDKQRYEQNKDVILERNKQYREKNKEIITKQRKAYRENNKDIIAETKKEHYQQNKEAINAKHREYYEQNKEIINARRRERRALQKSMKEATE